MTIAEQIRDTNLKLTSKEDPEIPINEEKLLIDCMIQGEIIDEGVFSFKDGSVLDTIDFHVACYKSLADFLLKGSKE